MVFFFKEQDEEVGWLRDTGGPKRCGTCGVMSAQSAGRVEERQYLLFALILPKELRGSVVVADDDVPVRLVVKRV